jgi:CheY-like chemotaxis protein
MNSRPAGEQAQISSRGGQLCGRCKGLKRADHLLLDLNLPRRTGTEVLRRLRQSPRCGHIPVVILTSSDAPKDREYANRLAADSYFRKPSDLKEFMKIRDSSRVRISLFCQA